MENNTLRQQVSNLKNGIVRLATHTTVLKSELRNLKTVVKEYQAQANTEFFKQLNYMEKFWKTQNLTQSTKKEEELQEEREKVHELTQQIIEMQNDFSKKLMIIKQQNDKKLAEMKDKVRRTKSKSQDRV